MWNVNFYDAFVVSFQSPIVILILNGTVDLFVHSFSMYSTYFLSCGFLSRAISVRLKRETAIPQSVWITCIHFNTHIFLFHRYWNGELVSIENKSVQYLILFCQHNSHDFRFCGRKCNFNAVCDLFEEDGIFHRCENMIWFFYSKKVLELISVLIKCNWPYALNNLKCLDFAVLDVPNFLMAIIGSNAFDLKYCKMCEFTIKLFLPTALRSGNKILFNWNIQVNKWISAIWNNKKKKLKRKCTFDREIIYFYFIPSRTRSANKNFTHHNMSLLRIILRCETKQKKRINCKLSNPRTNKVKN